MFGGSGEEILWVVRPHSDLWVGSIPRELCNVLRNDTERKWKPGLRIGTWNMRTMNRMGKMENV